MKQEYEKYYHPKFQIVANLIEILYSLNDCCCGGCCHIVTDDNNIRDSDLKFVINYCNENKDKIDCELSRTICEIMLQMSIEQRVVLFYSIGHWEFEDYSEFEYESFFEFYMSPDKIIENNKLTNDYNIKD